MFQLGCVRIAKRVCSQQRNLVTKLVLSKPVRVRNGRWSGKLKTAVHDSDHAMSWSRDTL